MADTPAGFASEPTRRSPKSAASDWRGASAAPSKGKLVAVTMILLLAIGGVIAGLIFWPKAPLEPRFVTIGIDQYGPLWPVNAWAENDSNKLNSVFGDRGSKAFNYQQADKFRQWLDWLSAKPGSTAADLTADFESRPLIIHIAALAAAKADGVYLLLPGASGAASAEWFPIDALLSAAEACPAPKKLLLLDIAHPVADPFNGILMDTVANALDAALVKRKADQKLPFAVLTSCGPGQQSLPCDAEGCSAFAFYVAEGLKGGADGAVDVSKADDQIMLSELARFTAARVDRWAGRCYGVRQTPTLYAPDDAAFDFVVSYKQKFPEDRYDSPAATAYPAGLSQAWQTLAAAVPLEEPVAYTRFAADLLRAEQLWARSGHPDRAEDAWRKAVAGWDEVSRTSVSGLTSADALKATAALAARWRLPATPLADAKVQAELGKLLDAVLTAKPEDEAKVKPAWQAKAAEVPADAVRLIWQRAVNTERPERADFRRWNDALAAVRLPRASAELLLLERLAKYDFVQTQGLAKAPTDALAALLKAEAAVGRVALANPHGFATLSARLTTADAGRREGERVLFAAKSFDPEVKAATSVLAVATVEIDRVLKNLEARQAASAAARNALQLLMATATPAIRHNAPEFATWKTAAQTLTTLFTKMAAAATNPASDGSEWGEELQDLAAVLPRLQELCDVAAVAKLLKETPSRTNAKDIDAMAYRLSGTALVGPIRGDVWNAVNADRLALHKAVRQLDKADDEAKTPIAALAADTPLPAVDVAMRRAEASVLLLAVAGAARMSDCEAGLRTVRADSGSLASWDLLGAALRTEWLTGVPTQTRDAQKSGQWLRAERLLRVTPAELARYRDASGTQAHPWQEALKADATAHRRWLLKQLADDAPLRARGDAATRFYDEARSDSQSP